MTGWQFWIDRGGTFTDVVAKSPNGKLITHKLLSENPEKYEDAPVQGIREVLGISNQREIPGSHIEVVRMGTTVATNALLERAGEPTALIINEGFRDALRIGYQNRPNIFSKKIILPEMLYHKVVELPGRISSDGIEVLPIDEKLLHLKLNEVWDSGIKSIAVVFMFSFRNPSHEKLVGSIAKKIGFNQISLSHEVSPLMKLISRGDTTVVDAYLSPLLKRYVSRINSHLSGVKLQFMQSSGGLVDADNFRGKDAVLSGPAGGVVGAAQSISHTEIKKIIGFDMGGTSTDVSRFDGIYERKFDSEVAGVRLRTPMMHIHTVAAGGGSILHFDSNRFRVGPGSAGANPGPACYRRGGPLTLTDCNVMLGKISGRHFPKVFGPNADQTIDEDIVFEKFEDLARKISLTTASKTTSHEVAEGFIRIAIQNMANAIKKISIQKGYDISEYALACFGAAGGQHACLVADELSIDTIHIHPHSGMLSAYGIGLAEVRDIKQKTIEIKLDANALTRLKHETKVAVAICSENLVLQGVKPSQINLEISLEIRYDGTDNALTVPYSEKNDLVQSFLKLHKQQFGFLHPNRELVIESLIVEAVGQNNFSKEKAHKRIREIGALPHPIDIKDIWIDGSIKSTEVYSREELEPKDEICGPAVIIEPSATTIIEQGWTANVNEYLHLILKRSIPKKKNEDVSTKVNPVMLEVFNNLFMSIAEQMGSTLENTAHSVNIKERLDFSCAVFDSHGGLIANAPHMPVHLGSMGESVKSIMENFSKDFRPGNSYATNDPYNGGTHLPDITVVTPVFNNAGTNILFFVASRGHHADIGGITPGSMPPFSKKVHQEGIIIDNFKLVTEGIFHERDFRKLLSSSEWPARNPDQNIADIMSQIAANEVGLRELHQAVAHFGLETVKAYMRHVQDNAADLVRRAIASLRSGSFNYPLDDGNQIKVKVDINHDLGEATIDFSGTSSQLKNNFNAPAAVCKASVLYVFRTLIEDTIPMNEGCLKPIEIIIPSGCMLNPNYPAAVVAGNVETSSHLTDALYGALGVLSAAQGTMNNFTFGNDEYQYYETISGGSGAGPGFDGTDAVQTHMTNSRLTDPEILEWRYPVRLESFQIRPKSGGTGKFCGGNGTIRRIRFLKPMTAAILSGHRIVKPFGLKGGAPGKTGKSYVERIDGVKEILRGADQIEINSGDIFTIETPGGGGYGSKD
tara:strand:+ start:20675 stop:24277 length:3603 start_codon:yes stop_codon:yes gene_type:complete